jgi:hypothetical protein
MTQRAQQRTASGFIKPLESLKRGRPASSKEESLIILLAGIPAAGKSTYACWMQKHERFLHLDVERPGVLTEAGLQAEWDAIFRKNHDTGALVAALRGRGSRVVIDWGFPPCWLTVINALQAQGVDAWWLDGDRHSSRRAFLARGTGSLGDYEAQMTAISEGWADIAATFRDKVIRTIESGPSYVPEPEFYARIRGNASSQ